MATCNFGKTNFSCYYTVGMNNGAEDFEDMAGEYLEDDLELVREGLRGVDGCTVYGNAEDMAEVWRTVEFMGIPFELGFSVCAKYGYYEGAYIDFKLYRLDCMSVDSVDELDREDLADMLEAGLWETSQAVAGGYRSAGQVRGLAMMQAGNFRRRLEAVVEAVREDLEKELQKCTGRLRCLGVMSNGGAVYEHVA